MRDMEPDNQIFNCVVSDRQLISVGGQTSNKDSQTSERTTKAVPKTPVYIAALIRLCRANISSHSGCELPCCFPCLSGPSTNRTLTLSPLPSAEIKYWK